MNNAKNVLYFLLIDWHLWILDFAKFKYIYDESFLVIIHHREKKNFILR